MATDANIQTNPLDLIRAGEEFVYREGQERIRGPLVIKDGASAILPDNAALIIEG